MDRTRQHDGLTGRTYPPFVEIRGGPTPVRLFRLHNSFIKSAKNAKATLSASRT